MATKFRFNYNNQTVDFDDYYVRSDIFTQGNLWSWGAGANAQLADNAAVKRSSPVQTVAQALIWRQIGGFGQYNGGGIKSDGTLWMWGANSFGNIGDNNFLDRSSPVQTVTGGTTWSYIATSCKASHVAAIKYDGTLWLWGRNNAGQIGDNTVVSKSSPVQSISTTSDWLQVNLASGATGAIKTDGSLWTWGDGFGGVLGDNTSASKSSPVQTIAGGTNWKQVAMGAFHCGAIKTDGSLWTWGYNLYGNIGDNTVVHRSSPVQTVSSGTNWKQVAAGGNHMAAIKTDGTLWTWGRNAYGQLGNNTTVNVSSPVQTTAFGNNWKQVACGYNFTCAVKTDGTLWTWGINSFFGTPIGCLGDNTGTNRSSPVQTVMGGTNWKQVACADQHAHALTYINP